MKKLIATIAIIIAASSAFAGITISVQQAMLNMVDEMTIWPVARAQVLSLESYSGHLTPTTGKTSFTLIMSAKRVDPLGLGLFDYKLEDGNNQLIVAIRVGNFYFFSLEGNGTLSMVAFDRDLVEGDKFIVNDGVGNKFYLSAGWGGSFE